MRSEAAAPKPTLRICAAADCQNPVGVRPNRRYCSDACGTRTRVREHRHGLKCSRCGAEGTHATKDCKTIEERRLDEKVRSDLELADLRRSGARPAPELKRPMACAKRGEEATAPELRTPEQQVADALGEELAAGLEAIERDFPGFVTGYTRWYQVVQPWKRNGSRWGVLRAITPDKRPKYEIWMPKEALVEEAQVEAPTLRQEVSDHELRLRKLERQVGLPEGGNKAAREAVEALLADLAEQEAKTE